MNATTANPECRLATADDLPQMLDLLAELGGEDFQNRITGSTIPEFCRWKYFEAPAGPAAVAIAVDSGRVVGIVAGVPKKTKVASETHLAFELGDFITAESYRRRGLFSRLGEMVCMEAAKRGGSFAYVRPNENSFPILVSRLGFREVARISERRYSVPSFTLQRHFGVPARWTQRIGLDSLVGRFLLPSPSATVEVRMIECFGSEFDDWGKRVEDRYRLCVARERGFLNWRYSDCPTDYRIWAAYREGAVAGYAVTFGALRASWGAAVDLFCGPNDTEVAATLLQTSMRQMLDDGVQSISTWIAVDKDGSSSARMLRRAFFRNGPALHFVVRPLTEEFRKLTFPPDGWRIVMGDFDGI